MSSTNYDLIEPVYPRHRRMEPRLLLDVTPSMTHLRMSRSPRSLIRRDYVLRSIRDLVAGIEQFDSMAAAEQAGGDKSKGGLFCVAFGGDEPQVIGDLNSTNLSEQLARIHWHGTTVIMPGWRALVGDYNEEFDGKENAPALLVEVITDGVADDTAEFLETLGTLTGNTRVAVGILGYGDEHDKALRAYQAMAKAHPDNLVVVNFAESSDPRDLTKAMLRLAGLN